LLVVPWLPKWHVTGVAKRMPFAFRTALGVLPSSQMRHMPALIVESQVAWGAGIAFTVAEE